MYTCLQLSSSIKRLSLGDYRLLNFEVMVVRNITRRPRLSKDIQLSRDF